MKNSLAIFDTTFEQATYCSMEAKTAEDKKVLFNAINAPEMRLEECVNKEINLKHVYLETVEFIDEDTGLSTPGIRIVLIDNDGKSYGCASKGVASALQKIFTIFGTPETWEAPLKVCVREIRKSDKRKILTMGIA